MRRHLRNGLDRMQRTAAAVGRYLAREIEGAELVTTLGLALLGRGLWLLSPAVALIVCGAVLVWWGLPTRAPFIDSRTPDERKGSR